MAPTPTSKDTTPPDQPSPSNRVTPPDQNSPSAATDYTFAIVAGIVLIFIVGWQVLLLSTRGEATRPQAEAPADDPDEGATLTDSCDLESGDCATRCEQDDGSACEQLATSLLSGEPSPQDKEQGIAIALRACDAGRAKGCVMAAFRIRRGDGVPADPARALALDARGCEAGQTAGCHNVAYAHLMGLGTPKDPAQARTWYQRSCDAGDRDSCRDLATLLVVGSLGMSADPTHASALALRACQGSLGAVECLRAGVELLNQSPPRAVVLFQALCSLANGSGCNNLGVIHERGLNGPVDVEKAREYYTLACNHDDAQGCRNRGIMGLGMGDSREEGKRWLTRGCVGDEQSHCDTLAQGALNPRTQAVAVAIIEELGCERDQAVSCSNLAASLMGAHGVERDEARAMTLFTHACDQGLPLACRNLAANLAIGRAGAAPDLSAAQTAARKGCEESQRDACLADADRWTDPRARMVLLEAACEVGQPDACSALAVMINEDGTVDTDKVRARALFETACANGDDGACNNLGYYLMQGIGGPVELERSASLFQRACDAGHAMGCKNMGVALQDGLGVAANAEQATAYFVRSCDVGLPTGCAIAAHRFAEGVHVAADQDRAGFYALRACALGESTVCEEIGVDATVAAQELEAARVPR